MLNLFLKCWALLKVTYFSVSEKKREGDALLIT